LKQIQYIPENDPDKIKSKINLIDPESKSDEGIGIQDYANMFKYSVGNWGFVLYFGSCMAAAAA
jgi:hypothetical protein